MKKKTLIICSIVSITVIASVIIFIIANNENGENNNNNVMSSISLPPLSSIDSNINPLLYDYINGSLGYHTEEDFIFNGLYYAILFDKETLLTDRTIFVSYYSFGEKITRPVLGYNPVEINVDEEQAQRILDSCDNACYKYSENNYTLIIVFRNQIDTTSTNAIDYCDSIGRWMNIDISKADLSSYGPMYNFIYNGYGWPNDWLRKNENYKKLMKNAYIDVDQPFWDRYNIDSYKIYKDDEGNTLTVYVKNINRFQFYPYDDKSKTIINVNEEQLKQMLDAYNYK